MAALVEIANPLIAWAMHICVLKYVNTYIRTHIETIFLLQKLLVSATVDNSQKHAGVGAVHDRGAI